VKNNYITSENGINLIIEFEGEVLHGYLDAVKILTIGVGHVVLKDEPYKLNGKITKAESERLLRQDLRIAENAINKEVQVPITQNQFDALVSLMFNSFYLVAVIYCSYYDLHKSFWNCLYRNLFEKRQTICRANLFKKDSHNRIFVGKQKETAYCISKKRNAISFSLRFA